MELLTYDEVEIIIKQLGYRKPLHWTLTDFSDTLVGYLGEHLTLTVHVLCDEGTKTQIKCFVKCIPRFDEWKATYLKELSFFKKEYVMLNGLFRKFENGEFQCLDFGGTFIGRYDRYWSDISVRIELPKLIETKIMLVVGSISLFLAVSVFLTLIVVTVLISFVGSSKWRPTCLFVREDLYVFEDVTDLGYKMPDHRHTLTINELEACVMTLAKFHAQSYIYEEKRSKELGKTFRLWDEYSENLQEPEKGMNWRNAGRNAVIDYLKVYSKHRYNPKFIETVESVVSKLYDKAWFLMMPSSTYRNAVVHRDLWTNNIFLKEERGGNIHAIFVDFQTVIYCSPMLDLSSLIYFNTLRDERESKITELIAIYYEYLSKELAASDVDVNTIIDRATLQQCYEDSIPFALVQASLIIPITTMEVEMREKIFSHPESSYRVNEVSRTVEIIDTAMQDIRYRNRVTDLFEEIVDRYIIPNGI